MFLPVKDNHIAPFAVIKERVDAVFATQNFAE